MCIKMHLFKKKKKNSLEIGVLLPAVIVNHRELSTLTAAEGSMTHASLINLVCLTDPMHAHLYVCARAFSLLAVFHLLCPNVCFCMDAVPVAFSPAAKSKPGTN